MTLLIRSRFRDLGLELTRRIYRWLALCLIFVYAVSGITTISPGEVGLIRRFGKWVTVQDEVAIFQPGLILAWPQPIDQVVRLPVKQETVAELDTFRQVDLVSDAPDRVLRRQQYAVTGDHNLIELKAIVRFRIEQPERYAIAFQNPKQTIQHVVQNAIAATVSTWSIDEVLTQLRESQSLSAAVLIIASRRLEHLELGAKLTSLEFNAVQPPAEVRDAFLAVHDSRVEQETLKQEALGEKAEKLIEAETVAQQAIADSKGKLVSRVAEAKSEAVMFEADLQAIRRDRSGETFTRLRRDAWEQILAQKGRVYAVSKDLAVGALHLTVPDVEKPR